MRKVKTSDHVDLKELFTPDIEKIVLFFVILTAVNYLILTPCAMAASSCAANYTINFLLFALIVYIPSCVAVHLTRR